MKNDRSWTEINLTNLEHNLNELKKNLPDNTQIMQIVKADAYGHGAFEIARKSIKNGVNFFGVANADEGAILRYQGIIEPILILSPSLISEIDSILENDLIPSISSIEFAEYLNDIADRQLKIHLNIDTGMGRSGFYYSEALGKIRQIQNLKNLEIDGIFSHFSAAENDVEYTKLQSERFERLLRQLDFNPKYIHISNSSGIITSTNKFTNLVRTGLLSYGIYTDDSLKSKIDLKPVMTFKSRISQLKYAKNGDSIGYNRTFVTKKNLKYAILPIGYADGYDFLLSNKGKVLIQNQLGDVIGKVSMDMMAIDVSGISDVKVGEEVILLGDDHEYIKAENLTQLYHGSSYEILCQIGRRAKRYYKENGETTGSSPLLRREFVSRDYSDKKLSGIIETAIEQRLQSKEIADLIYRDILKRFFVEKDRDIFYRRKFRHTIEFQKENFKSPSLLPNGEAISTQFHRIKTTLTFTKKLQNDYFYVACAKNEKLLEKYFLRRDVEYRWLLDHNFDLDPHFFNITSVKINDIELNNENKISAGCIETRCSHPKLKELVGKEVDFSISTQTYYPKNSRQLGIYITEITQGVDIKIIHNEILANVEAVPIFSGQMKFPSIKQDKKSITVSSKDNEWIFPNSGVVFVYRV